MVAPQLDAALDDLVVNHVRRDFTKLRADQTVEEALVWLRQHPPEGRILYFYVVDADDRLVGVVPTRRLLLSPLEKRLADIMVSPIIAIPDTATVLDACEFFTMHKLLAFPVVDSQRRMLGIVDIELYTEELSDLDASQRGDDLFQLVGVHLSDAQQQSSLASFRQRFPWLLCNIGGGVLAAFLAGMYADTLRHVALALFIPVVLALSESVSIQSLSLTLQTLHAQRPSWTALLARIRRESFTGALLGGACGAIVGLVGLVWLRQHAVALCLLLGIVCGVAASAALGLAIPYLLKLLRRDPQVAAGPITLASADMVTLLAYFNLARWLLN